MNTRMVAAAVGAAFVVTGCGSAQSQSGGSADDSVSNLPGGQTSAAGGDPQVLADTRGDGPFFIDAISPRVAESYPVQIFLEVDGSAPTRCHHVAYSVSETPDGFDIDITTVSPEQVCAQVLAPRRFVVPLGPADLPATLVVNDGEFVETIQP